VLGILALVLAVFAGLGIAAVILIPNMMRANTNASNSNVDVSKIDNSNRNSSNANSNESNSTGQNENNGDNSDEDQSLPPTDEQEVRSDLKDLEDEWTVANINADKKKLDRILADDYVDTSQGTSRGKAEYLKTVERDAAIQHWEFQDLKVSLKGDRATLSGIVRFDIKDQQGQDRQVPFTFKDKFVWRDGRWQATGSEVKPLNLEENNVNN
jgi:ketosteroid isomerase-like protein